MSASTFLSGIIIGLCAFALLWLFEIVLDRHKPRRYRMLLIIMVAIRVLLLLKLSLR